MKKLWHMLLVKLGIRPRYIISVKKEVVQEGVLLHVEENGTEHWRDPVVRYVIRRIKEEPDE